MNFPDKFKANRIFDFVGGTEASLVPNNIGMQIFCTLRRGNYRSIIVLT